MSLGLEEGRRGARNVEHFLGVAEAEMACESFILSVLEEQIQLTDDVKAELLDLALALQLNEASVFRADFWQLLGPYSAGKIDLTDIQTSAVRPEVDF